jgi:hypothetical protein
MKKHVVFVAGLAGFLVLNALVIRYCWATKDSVRPPEIRRTTKPATATAFEGRYFR